MHAHFILIDRQRTISAFAKETLSTLFTSKINCFTPSFDSANNNIFEIHHTFQPIKSACSYLHYLQSVDKGTFYIIASNEEMAKLFCNFDKNIIFPSDSAPKRLKRTVDGTVIKSDNDLVLFFMQKLHSNVTNYNKVLKDWNIQRFLHIPNLKNIWENCLHQFRSGLSHERNVCFILNSALLYAQKNVLCCCPVLDILHYQNIDVDKFQTDLVIWLFGTDITQKRNALLFQGPPDSGKSFFARALWDLFYCHERIVNDGLFSFANAPGAGCLLWEETHIPPELAEITKLILEGNPTVAVSIKGKNSVMLNKRVPIIITNNKDLGVYCQNNQSAFDARCFKYVFARKVPKLCQSSIHTCDYVMSPDAEDSSYSNVTTSNPSSPSHNEDENPSVQNCVPFHPLTSVSVKSFIVRSIIHNLDVIEDLPQHLYTVELYNLIGVIKTKGFEALCNHSKLLQ